MNGSSGDKMVCARQSCCESAGKSSRVKGRSPGRNGAYRSMKKKWFRGKAIIVLMAVLVGNGMNALARANEKTNILLIFADDWGWGDLGCHGHPYVKTPNIDRLAQEGMDFHHFVVASGVCSPSRTAVMTGHFPARYNIDGHFAWADQNAKRNMPDWLDPQAPLLSRFLQRAGYATAHFGKWHLSNNMIPESQYSVEFHRATIYRPLRQGGGKNHSEVRPASGISIHRWRADGLYT